MTCGHLLDSRPSKLIGNKASGNNKENNVLRSRCVTCLVREEGCLGLCTFCFFYEWLGFTNCFVELVLQIYSGYCSNLGLIVKFLGNNPSKYPRGDFECEF